MELHPQVRGKGAKKEFVILPYEEHERIAETLDDYDDLRESREAKSHESNAANYTFGKILEMVSSRCKNTG